MPWNLYGAITRDAVRFVYDDHANHWLIALHHDGDPTSWTVCVHRTDGCVEQLAPTRELPPLPGVAPPGPVCGWWRGPDPGYVVITTVDGQTATLRAYDHQR